MALQTHVETIVQSIQDTRQILSTGQTKSLENGDGTAVSDGYLNLMDTMQASLLQNVDHLFSSLSIGDGFPDLCGFPLPFVQTLILARDLKRNIQMRAVAAFFECDRLDQAVGGKEEALGMFYLISCENIITLVLNRYASSSTGKEKYSKAKTGSKDSNK